MDSIVDDVDELRETVERMHGGTPVLAQSIPVAGMFGDEIAWQGTVHVFDLVGHPTATCAYVWSSPAEHSTERRLFAALHTDSINSPLDAVRAAIMTEYKFR